MEGMLITYILSGSDLGNEEAGQYDKKHMVNQTGFHGAGICPII